MRLQYHQSRFSGYTDCSYKFNALYHIKQTTGYVSRTGNAHPLMFGYGLRFSTNHISDYYSKSLIILTSGVLS